MKTFQDIRMQLDEADVYIYNTKPETLRDAEDPEVLIQGYGRMRYSQLEKKVIEQLEEFVKLAKRGNFSGIETNMKVHHMFLSGIQEVQKEMSSSGWKRKTTKLKRAGK
jgi:hypothetical protein|tara:strand:- start:1108 stop:1434 length:327 start_codon:yes stop_codon:yes gene_type:complete